MWQSDSDAAKACCEIVRSLSPRTQAVLAGLWRGRAEKEIANDLAMSRHTVHAYVKRIYRAFRVQRRADLIQQLSEGLGMPGQSALEVEYTKQSAGSASSTPPRASSVREIRVRLPAKMVERLQQEHGNVEVYITSLIQAVLGGRGA